MRILSLLPQSSVWRALHASISMCFNHTTERMDHKLFAGSMQHCWEQGYNDYILPVIMRRHKNFICEAWLDHVI